jgi:hypothetical protein
MKKVMCMCTDFPVDVLLQNGVNKLSELVGVTLGPKGRNVVLESKYGSPKIVNDGVTVAKEVRRPLFSILIIKPQGLSSLVPSGRQVVIPLPKILSNATSS